MYALIVIYVINHQPNVPTVALFTTRQQCEQVQQAAGNVVEKNFGVPPSAVWTKCQSVAVVDAKGNVHDTTGGEL